VTESLARPLLRKKIFVGLLRLGRWLAPHDAADLYRQISNKRQNAVLVMDMATLQGQATYKPGPALPAHLSQSAKPKNSSLRTSGHRVDSLTLNTNGNCLDGKSSQNIRINLCLTPHTFIAGPGLLMQPREFSREPPNYRINST
jgi:hypothetical protein